jgi:hypothetical protein
MGENKGQEITSEATAIKLLGTALEKIEKELLLEMGGQIRGFNPIIEIGIPARQCIDAKVTISFDLDVLKDYLNGTYGPGLSSVTEGDSCL